jgi:integrase
MAIIPRGAGYGVRIKRSGKQVWLGTRSTLKEARELEAQGRLESKSRDLTKMTVRELAELFHEQHTDFKSTSTQGNYRHAIGKFVDAYGDKRPGAITFIEAQAFAGDNPRSTTDCASTMFEWARKARLIDVNPFDGVIRRQVKSSVKVQILSKAEVDKLAGVALRILDTPMAEQMAALIMFSAGTGLRPGESFALTWGDIDFTAERVSVSKAIGAKGEIKSPKNGKARKAPLLTLAREGLQLLDRGDPHELVFTSNRDNALSRSTLAYRWHTVRGKADLDEMRFYDLRHTFATHLLELGVYSYEVAEAMGHTDGGRLVERTYGHPSAERALDRITQLDRVASQPPAETQGVAPGVATGAEAAS